MRLELFLARRVPRESLNIDLLRTGQLVDILEMTYNYGSSSCSLPSFRARVQKPSDIKFSITTSGTQLFSDEDDSKILVVYPLNSKDPNATRVLLIKDYGVEWWLSYIVE